MWKPKKITTVYLDEEIIKEAKSKYINISEAAERGIKDQLGIKEIEIKEPVRCEVCQRLGKKETKEDIIEKGHWTEPSNLTWLWPDEIWICNSCLKTKVNKAGVAGRIHQ